MNTEVKKQENRLRDTADRRGYKLMKSRTRDELALDYGLYALIDHNTSGAANPSQANGRIYSWTLDDVEKYLNSPHS